MVSKELEYLINRRKALEQEKMAAWENFQAVMGAIQECEISIKQFTEMAQAAENEESHL
jgi:uncharacterized protein YaaN involved in tellurite resistance